MSKKEEKIREEFRTQLEEEEKLLQKLQKEESEARVRRRKDFMQRLELEKREASQNGTVMKAQEVANLQQDQFAQEEKLAAELDLIRRKEIVDEKLRLHLRENSHELKELESQLRLAYTNKAIAAQIAEREANKLEDQLRERRARELLEKATGTLAEQEMADRLKEKKQKEEFRQLLQDQIIDKERMRQEEFISFMNEKKMHDDIIKKIRDEEAKELEQKKIMQEKLKEEMQQFYMAREMWKAKERLTIQEEEEKIKQINEEKARAKLEENNRKKGNSERSEMLYKMLANEAAERKRIADEREELLSALILNETKQKEIRKEEEEKEKEMQRKVEARATYQQILADKCQRKKEEKEWELRLVEEMRKKSEEEEKKEREKQEQRRQIQISNRKYNEEVMRKNVQKRAEGLKLTQLVNELQEREEKRKENLIKEERIRMLEEHAPRLLGHFPKGCLRQEDLEILGITGNSPLPESCPLAEE